MTITAYTASQLKDPDLPVRLLLLCHDEVSHVVLGVTQPMAADAVIPNNPKFIPLIVKSKAPVNGDSESNKEMLTLALEYENTLGKSV